MPEIYSRIKVKRSQVDGAIPPSDMLVDGELALNYRNGTLFYKNAAGVISVLLQGDLDSIISSATVPATPHQGLLWQDTSDGVLSVYDSVSETFITGTPIFVELGGVLPNLTLVVSTEYIVAPELEIAFTNLPIGFKVVFTPLQGVDVPAFIGQFNASPDIEIDMNLVYKATNPQYDGMIVTNQYFYLVNGSMTGYTVPYTGWMMAGNLEFYGTPAGYGMFAYMEVPSILSPIGTYNDTGDAAFPGTYPNWFELRESTPGEVSDTFPIV